MPHHKPDSPLLKTARERFKLANDADTDQSNREQEDLAFYAGDQWPADIKLARQGRPTLVINKVREPVRQVQNEIRESDIGVELTPADDFGDLGITPDDTEITLREGLIRRIIRDSKGQDGWNWAGDRADICGRGYFAVLTRYLPGKTSDQEVYIERIFNQASVKGDPSRTEPDGSDADYWFWGTFMLADRVIAQWPKTSDGIKNPFADYNDAEFMGAAEAYPNWFRSQGADDKKTWSIRVENYVYTDRVSRELLTFPDGEVYWADEVPDGAEIPEDVERRTVVEPQIKFCIIAGGCVVLEERDWPGPDMPIIETIGEELHPYDEQRRIEGMVRNAMDSNRGFNYMVSKQVEMVGLTPLAPMMVDPLAIEGYEQLYQQMNTRTFGSLPYRTYDDQGRQLRDPARPPVSDLNMGVAQSIAFFDAAIKSTTAVPDPTLGNVDPSLKSGKAIRETVANAKASTSNFVTNRARSIRRAAEVINNLLFPIYGRPGRMVRVMTGEGSPEMMVVGDQEQLQAKLQQRQKAVKVAKLTEDAHFNIAVKITKNFDTRRQQENTELGNLIAAEPQLMTWFGDLYLGSSDMPGRKQLAERAKTMLAPPILEMEAAKDQGRQYDPQAQAEISALKQQMQQLEAFAKEQAEIANTKRLESMTKLEIERQTAAKDLELERMRLTTELEKARMDNATKQYVADLQAKTQGQLQASEHEHDEMATATQLVHEDEQARLDREAQATMAAHDAALAEGAADREGQEAERGRQFEATEKARDRVAASQEGEKNREAASEQGAD